MRPESLPEEILSAYADDECTADERVAVEARLASDPQWREILDEVRAASAVVRALPSREPPVGFVEALVEQDDTGPARHRVRRPRVIAGIGAAAAIAVGFLLASPTGRDNEVAPPLATLADSHGATLSLQSDPLSGLAPIAATSGIEP